MDYSIYLSDSLAIVFGVVGAILLLIGIAIAVREGVCWYWKQNEIVKLLEEQNALLKALIKSIHR